MTERKRCNKCGMKKAPKFFSHHKAACKACRAAHVRHKKQEKVFEYYRNLMSWPAPEFRRE